MMLNMRNRIFYQQAFMYYFVYYINDTNLILRRVLKILYICKYCLKGCMNLSDHFLIFAKDVRRFPRKIQRCLDYRSTPFSSFHINTHVHTCQDIIFSTVGEILGISLKL